MSEAIVTDACIIEQTNKWLKSVVIGLGFCPFAKREMERNRVHYCVVRADDLETCLESMIVECERLDRHQDIATSLLIYPGLWTELDDFLDYLGISESLLEVRHYQGIYQLASFHPLYRFEAATEKDPANYTNRSPYPMLHLLREDMLEAVLKQYPNSEQIPQQNILHARELGATKLKAMLDSCRF